MNVVDLILTDHREIEQLLKSFESVPADGREDYFCHVVQELVRHEVAEEQVIYPALSKDAPGGKDQAAQRIAEQSKAERMLADMEKLDKKSQDFAAKVIQLREAVLEHATAEESQAFPLLRQSEDSDKLEAMAGRYQSAKAAAPTHPHPHAPDTPPGNMILGPVAAVADRIRDAIRSS
jgi:hemerythrin superfamily protein